MEPRILDIADQLLLATDFKSLRYVQIVHNPLAAEQDSMRLKQ